MRVEYEFTKQDYIDFNIYHMKNSDTIKKSLFIQRYIFPIVFLVMPFFLVRITEIPLWYWFTAFIITTIIWMAFYEKHIMTTTMKRLSQMIDEGKSKDLLGKHTIIIDEDGFIDRSNNAENKFNWNGVEKIVSTNQHFFLYINSLTAYVIPKSAFESDNSKDLFFEFVNERIAKNYK